MKYLSVIFFLSIYFFAKSQEHFNQNYAYMVYWTQKYPVEVKDSGKVSEVKIIETRKKKKITIVKKYDEKGNLTGTFSGKNDDSLAKKSVFMYDKDNRMIKATFFKKHKIDRIYNYNYNEENLVNQLLVSERDGEIIQNQKWTYNENKNVTEATATAYKSNSTDVKFRWKYEYSGKDKLSHVSYYKKDKLKKEWDYNCDEEGEQVSRKNFYKVCKWEETSKDTLTAVYQITNHKGKITKSVYKYTVKDTLILALYQYDENNKLRRKYTYEKSFDKQLSYIHYKKGKPKYEWNTTYSGEKVLSRIGKRRGKTFSSTSYVYNDSGRVTEVNSTYKNKKFNSSSKIEYVMR